MALQPLSSEFCFSKVELFKGETIGSGAYGAVCKARCDNLHCAAKLLYNALLEVQDTPTDGSKIHRSPLNRFKQECQFLSRVNHPNIVQYLGTHCDPDSKVMVLLMELMDESLTNYLDRSAGSVSLHMQINISYDIILALAYLHTNNIIHRDLSSNNVLLTASRRAKVSDFGMSTILGKSGVPNSLTVCPGNVIYMPPEALDEPPLYTKSLDVFSFGVLLIQINSCQFPCPTNRFTTVDIISPVSHKAVSAKISVPEVERRQHHIEMMTDTNPLLPAVKDCLSDSGDERPLASELCDRFEAMKSCPEYLKSKEDADTKVAKSGSNRQEQIMSENIYELDEEILCKNRLCEEKLDRLGDKNEALQERVEDLEQLLSIRARELQKLIKSQSIKEEECIHLKTERDALRTACGDSENQVQPLNVIIEDLTRDNLHLREQIHLQDSTIADLQVVVDDREDYISSTKAHLLAEIEVNQKLRAQMEKRAGLVSQESTVRESPNVWINQARPTKVHEVEILLRKKETEVKDLKKIIAIKDSHITSLQDLLQAAEAKLLQQYRPGGKQKSVKAKLDLPPEAKPRPLSPRQINLSIEWESNAGMNAPCPIQAGSTAVHDGKVYLRPANRGEIFEFCPKLMTWKKLERCPSSACTLVNCGNLLTTVGGKETKKLWSYVTVGKGGFWTEVYPEMRVERYNAAVASSNDRLVVAGGFLQGWSCTSDVDVLDVTSSVWFKTQSLPYSIYSSSATICCNTVYIIGGYFEKARGQFSVLSCPLANLTESGDTPTTEEAAATWSKVADLPVCRSTCITFKNRLAVVGGRMVNGCESSVVYLYNSVKSTWTPVISDMIEARSECHAAVVNDEKIVVAGGCIGSDMTLIDRVEVGEIRVS